MILLFTLLLSFARADMAIKMDQLMDVRVYLKNQAIAYIDHRDWVVIDPDKGQSPLNWLASDQKYRHGRDIVIITNPYMWGFDSRSTWVFDLRHVQTEKVIHDLLLQRYPNVVLQRFEALKLMNNCRLFGETAK